MDQLLLKPEDVARTLNLGRTKVYELIMKGDLPSIVVGKCRRVPADALRKWIDKQLEEQGAA